MFDRTVDRVERELAINEQALQRSAPAERFGGAVRRTRAPQSEVLALIKCREADATPAHVERMLWISLNRGTLTTVMIDPRDVLAAKRIAEEMLPA